MNIALLIDKPTSAIDRLSQAIKKYNPHLDINIVPLHPKRPDADQIKAAKAAFDECDILHVGYWRSGEKLREYVNPTKLEEKPKILCHYNPYDVRITKEKASQMGLSKNMTWRDDSLPDDKNAANWEEMYDMVVVGNSTILADYPVARLVNYGVDLDFFKYTDEYTDRPVVNMVVGRIEGKKGCLEVAKVCKKLGYKFLLVGRISKANYFEEIKRVYETDEIKWPGDRKPRLETMFEFRENVSDEELRDAYYESAIHVCNSVDGFESGTLPILEAMSCGVPVLTRNVGHVPDLYSEDGQNMVVRSGDQGDLKDLEKELKDIVENPYLREKMRNKGWETVKNWGLKRMAWKFEQLYYELIRQPEISDDGQLKPFVSVIVPTMDRPDVALECLSKIIVQDYEYFEIVVVDSGKNKIPVNKFKDYIKKRADGDGLDTLRLPPIKYVHFDRKGEYSLARARNLGILQASGDLLVFCDDRIGMEPGAITAFVSNSYPNQWVYGVKDGSPKGFVENFSCVSRNELIEAGMFNESICRQYGCMTQEIRTRLERVNSGAYPFRIINSAKAKQISRTSGRSKRRKDIIKSKDIIFKLYHV